MQPYTQQAVPGSGGQYGTGAMEMVGQFGPATPAPPHPMGPPPPHAMHHPHPGVHLAHPYHPMFGWRGGPGAQPVVFAGYPAAAWRTAEPPQWSREA